MVARACSAGIGGAAAVGRCGRELGLEASVEGAISETGSLF